MRIYRLHIILTILGLLVPLAPSVVFAAESERYVEELSHPGYVDDVRDERGDISREVIIVPLSEPDHIKLVDQIFTQSLTLDFRKEFRARFGVTEYEQIDIATNRFDDIGQGDGHYLSQSETDNIQRQRQFGDYMLRRLIEFHVNKYLKENRETRVIYETEQKLSNVKIQGPAHYDIKLKYDLAANRFLLFPEKNGQVWHEQLDIKMGGGAETTMRVWYDVTKTVLVGGEYAIKNETSTLRTEKQLSPTLRTSVSAQQFNKDVGDTPAQKRFLLGLSWND